ncbi:DUF3618 domain-containing protein [Micromonospora foliorum]|uniref:DUF3618 domain-containing protein n=1 Tax=Micromonospora foliorum TaxID=2911210 RepID=UPI001EE9A432|nr:DUF3618 domain-containing protein [Micromonospora foliorum]MCG5438118.1 DUF3618 domain-containing protein [Micromonospora foliorum]
MSTPPASSDPDRSRRDIQQTRAELGETVAALAAKTDVKTRARTKATAAAGGLRQRVTQAGQSAKTRATQLAHTMSQKASQRAKPVTQQAQRATTAIHDSAQAGAQTTGKAESTLITSARAATTRIGSSVRAKPVPVLAATSTAATLVIIAYRRRRSR